MTYEASVGAVDGNRIDLEMRFVLEPEVNCVPLCCVLYVNPDRGSNAEYM